MKTRAMATLLGAGLLASAVAFTVPSQGPNPQRARSAIDVAGYLYTSLNGEGANQVVAFGRMSDGTIGTQTTYSSGSMGGANRAAGGDAAGDTRV